MSNTTKRKPGRPRVIAGGVRVAVFLSAEQAAWLREQPDGNSETVRQLIDQARESEWKYGDTAWDEPTPRNLSIMPGVS